MGYVSDFSGNQHNRYYSDYKSFYGYRTKGAIKARATHGTTSIGEQIFTLLDPMDRVLGHTRYYKRVLVKCPKGSKSGRQCHRKKPIDKFYPQIVFRKRTGKDWCLRISQCAAAEHLFDSRQKSAFKRLKKMFPNALRRRLLGREPLAFSGKKYLTEHNCRNREFKGSPMDDSTLVNGVGGRKCKSIGAPTINVRAPFSQFRNDPARLYIRANRSDTWRFHNPPVSKVRMILNAKVGENWPSVESANIMTSVSEVAVEGLPVRPSKLLEFDRNGNTFKKSNSTLRTIIPSEWLRYNFGIAPLAGAIADAAQAEAVLDKAIRTINSSAINDTFVNGKSFKFITKPEHACLGYNSKNIDSGSMGSKNSFKWETSVESEFYAHLKIMYKPDFINAASQLSLYTQYYFDDFSTIVWELTPFSWAYDYFNKSMSRYNNYDKKVQFSIKSVQVTYSISVKTKVETSYWAVYPIWVKRTPLFGMPRCVAGDIQSTPRKELPVGEYNYYTRGVVKYNKRPRFNSALCLDEAPPIDKIQTANLAAVAAMLVDSYLKNH